MIRLIMRDVITYNFLFLFLFLFYGIISTKTRCVALRSREVSAPFQFIFIFIVLFWGPVHPSYHGRIRAWDPVDGWYWH